MAKPTTSAGKPGDQVPKPSGAMDGEGLYKPPRQTIGKPDGTYTAKITSAVWLATTTAASAGLLFGFDNGIIGGVTGSADFQSRFLPSVYDANFVEGKSTGNYCKYDSQVLQLIVSSLYLSAGIFSLAAPRVSRNYGRSMSMLLAGVAFGVGIILLAAAQDIAMVVVGRVLMGAGVGLANSSSVLYIVEMAPPQHRGAMGIMFQLVQCVGILLAYIYNYAFRNIEWGWRLAIALGGIHAVIMIIGASLLPDTPASLLSRGKAKKALKVLKWVRGSDAVDAEFQELVQIVEASRRVTNGYRSLLFDARYRPMLAVVIAMPIMQQWTGINSVIFYTPQIFSYVSHAKGLLDTVVVGVVNVAATVVSVILVDRLGRKKLFTWGGLQMAACMIIIASTLGTGYGKYPSGKLPEPMAKGLLAVFCTFCAGYAWSFGPLPWLLPTEVQPLETRAAAASLNTFLNMLMTFAVAQSFQTQLCSERWGVFAFFAGLTVAFVVLINLFLPETMGKAMDQIAVLFGEHWAWGKLPAVRQLAGERRDDAEKQAGQPGPATFVAQ